MVLSAMHLFEISRDTIQHFFVSSQFDKRLDSNFEICKTVGNIFNTMDGIIQGTRKTEFPDETQEDQ